jgi:glycosyltransferase involved in cell wall biosynthesis
VIPCYNEEKRFDVAAVDSYLSANVGIDIVLVNDGSRDGTFALLETLRSRWAKRVILVDQQPNQGKGEAVRVGILRAIASGATYVGYFDADLSTPLDAVTEFIRVLDKNPEIDIVLGARVALLGRQIERRPLRHYFGRVFATAASIALALPVYDTQCGAKLIRVGTGVRRIFDDPFESRWIFDVELLARYLNECGSQKGLYELALQRWTDVGDSRVKMWDFVRAAVEITSIYRKYRHSATHAGKRRFRVLGGSVDGSNSVTERLVQRPNR